MAIRVVEYNPGYAESIAVMWNESTASWGGDSRVRTAEGIIREHEQSPNLHVYLAVTENDKVVGYCSFSEYRYDEQALYVPLLNVHPAYHNQKVGKELVLGAVRETIAMGWPRVDLYTWSGNTKAVPLYKKCGFFWERRDDTVHLMNFIPTVVRTEALESYFQETLDWYGDSVRPIAIEPDGIRENGFDYFEYAWEKDGIRLRVQFERTGRGIRLIETDDYLIESIMESHELAFGFAYPIRYRVVNKTGKPLEIKIKGQNHKQIRFDIERSFQVVGTEEVSGEFHLDSMMEDQEPNKTHPSVTAEVEINGKRALFRHGILPKFPMSINLSALLFENYIGVSSTAVLALESNLAEEAVFRFTLPTNDIVEFEESQVEVTLAPKQKQSVLIPFKLKRFGVLNEEITVEASSSASSSGSSDGSFSFTRTLSSVFRGRTGRYSGETERQWIIFNQEYSLALVKHDNNMFFNHKDREGNQPFWMYPKLGKPFSPEFSKEPADHVEFLHDDSEGRSAIILRAHYLSKEFPGVRLICSARLHGNGIAERWFDIVNEGPDEMQDLCLSESFYHDMENTVLPYDGEYLDLRETKTFEVEWDSDRISENWLFSYGEKSTRAVSWPKEAPLTRTDWHLAVEFPLQTLASGSTIRTAPTVFSIGTFQEWDSFRGFAFQEETEPGILRLSDPVNWQTGTDSPILRNSYSFRLEDRLQAWRNCSLTLSSENGAFEPMEFKTGLNEKGQVLTGSGVAHSTGQSLDIVTLTVESESQRVERKQVVFYPLSNSSSVECSITQHSDGRESEAGELYTVNNGAISYQASAAYSTGVHSLMYQGKEWLDSPYPTPGPKSWWNPWFGGITAEPAGMNGWSVGREKKTARFVRLQDSTGLFWEGVGITMAVEENRSRRGLVLEHFYLTLPGLPILCVVVHWSQDGSLTGTKGRIKLQSFFRPDSDLNQCRMAAIQTDGGELLYKAGTTGIGTKIVHPYAVYSSSRENSKLIVSTDFKRSYNSMQVSNHVVTGYHEQPILHTTEASGYTIPVYYFFGNHLLRDEWLKPLHGLRFRQMAVPVPMDPIRT